MKTSQTYLVLGQLVLFFLLSTMSISAQFMPPPSAKKIPKEFKEFGRVRIDNYHWMNNRDSTVIEHLKKENEYALKKLQHTEELQEALYRELMNRQSQNFTSLPIYSNGYKYYIKQPQEKSYPVHYRQKSDASTEEVVQDFNDFAIDGQVLGRQQPVISPNNKYALISIDTKGNNRNMVIVKDLENSSFLTDTVVDKSYNFPVWSSDSKGFYYVQVDSITMRSTRVKYHRLGTARALDELIYFEKDSQFSIYILPSGDQEYLFINSYTPTSTGINYLGLRETPAEVRSLVNKKDNIQYRVIDNSGNEIFFYTNDSAPNFKVVKGNFNFATEGALEEIIPESPEVFHEPYFMLVKNHLITKQRKNGIARLNILDIRTGENYDLNLEQETGSFSVSLPNDILVTDSIRISYRSYAVPGIDYSYDLKERKLRKIREKQLPEFSSGNYTTAVIEVPVRDGTAVPVSMVFHKDKYQQDGNHPMILETYSWYNFANDPYFKSDIISLLDRGFIYVYPHARGGAEKGPKWWDEGRRLKRMNTFFDVIDCAKYLISNNYTSSEKLVGMGTSAGGTNIGAIINLEPDLFKAVVAEVPWLDVLTDMQNPNVPGVVAEYEEEGNPHIFEEFNYMALWSPYDNVTHQDYPAVFTTAGWHDNNVPFYHAPKWVSKLREYSTGDQPVLLLTNLNAGHAGPTDKFEKAKATARKYAFILDAVGIKE